MVKKLIAAGTIAATVLMLAGGALAERRDEHKGGFSYGEVEDNKVIAISNTGLNSQIGGSHQYMRTGRSYADAFQSNTINSSTCDCDKDGKDGKKIGEVEDNWVVAVSSTGLNKQIGGHQKKNGGPVNTFGGDDRDGRDHHGSSQYMRTGSSEAYAYQWNVINSSVSTEEVD